MFTILYHDNCPDGFASAYWLRRNLLNDPAGHIVHLVPARYGEAPPLEFLEGQDVRIVDFCYPGDELEKIAMVANSVVVLDHHVTATQYVAEQSKLARYDSVLELPFTEPFGAVLDMGRSGIGLTVDYVTNHLRRPEDPPAWFVNLEDRDLWRFEHIFTREIFAAVTSRPYTIEAWDQMVDMHPDALAVEGTAINRYRDQLIAQVLDTAYTTTVLGHEVWVAACPYAIGSEVAGELAKRNPTKFGAYYVDYGSWRKWGLRSGPDGINVAELAETVGGGGHKHAAGFEER